MHVLIATKAISDAAEAGGEEDFYDAGWVNGYGEAEDNDPIMLGETFFVDLFWEECEQGHVEIASEIFEHMKDYILDCGNRDDYDLLHTMKSLLEKRYLRTLRFIFDNFYQHSDWNQLIELFFKNSHESVPQWTFACYAVLAYGLDSDETLAERCCGASGITENPKTKALNYFNKHGHRAFIDWLESKGFGNGDFVKPAATGQ